MFSAVNNVLSFPYAGGDASSELITKEEQSNSVAMVPLSDYLKLYKEKEEKAENRMDDNMLLEKYMEKVDSDQKELRKEMREREERVLRNTESSEKRSNERLDRIERLIEKQNESLDSKLCNMENKLDNAVRDIKGNKLQIWSTCIATLLAIAGIAYGAIQVFQGFVSIVAK